MKILIFSYLNPYPPIDGGRIRIWKMAKALKDLGVGLRFVVPGSTEDSMTREGISIHSVRVSPIYFILTIILNFLNNRLGLHTAWIISNWINLKYFEKRMASFIEYLSKDIDLIQCEFPWFHRVPYHVSRTRSIPIIITKHDIQAKIICDTLRSKNALAKFILLNIFKCELQATINATAVVCPNYENANELEKNGVPRKKLFVIPHGANGSAIKGITSIERRDKIAVFTGSRHPPNVEAVKAICNVIAPRVPEVRFVIIGSVKEDFKNIMCPKNVAFTGYISLQDLEDLYQRASVAILPLTIGSGMKVKTIEFLSAGTPIVSTSIGVQGYTLQNMEDAIIEDDLTRFPTWIRTLIDNHILWSKLSNNGLKQASFSWIDVAREYLNLYETLVKTNN